MCVFQAGPLNSLHITERSNGHEFYGHTSKCIWAHAHGLPKKSMTEADFIKGILDTSLYRHIVWWPQNTHAWTCIHKEEHRQTQVTRQAPLTPSFDLMTTFHLWPALFNKIVTANFYWAPTVCQRLLRTLYALVHLILTLNVEGRSWTLPFTDKETEEAQKAWVFYQRSYS